jgi:purine nucleosidase
MRRIWIDTDMGFDDLAAVAMVAACGDIDIAGLSLVAGNTPLPIVADNAARACAFFGWSMPVYPGCARPIVGKAVTAERVLGRDGMPTVGRRMPPAELPDGGADAMAGLTRFLEEGGGDILALGPLTNIAVLALTRPDLLARIPRLVWMGGSAGPGNETAAAEFNAFADPEAAEIVIAAGLPVAMVDLQACRQVTLGLGNAASLRAVGGSRSEILADLLEGYVRIASPDGSQPMALYDPVAAAAVIAPESVVFAPAHLAIECAGRHTRGMTVVEWRVPRRATANAEVSRSADADRICRMFHAALAAAATGPR